MELTDPGQAAGDAVGAQGTTGEMPNLAFMFQVDITDIIAHKRTNRWPSEVRRC